MCSERDPRDPNPEFVWNSWLRQPLVELGLYDHCPALLQAGRGRLCVLSVGVEGMVGCG